MATLLYIEHRYSSHRVNAYSTCLVRAEHFNGMNRLAISLTLTLTHISRKTEANSLLIQYVCPVLASIIQQNDALRP